MASDNDFSQLTKFAKKIQAIANEQRFKQLRFEALGIIGKHLEQMAKEKVGGHLQQGEGIFWTWEPLAESTRADKERLGLVFNADYNPLYRTGELRASISHSVETVGNKAIITLGSTDQIMVYQELGTPYAEHPIPPRSVLGLTMFQERKFIEKALGEFILKFVAGNKK